MKSDLERGREVKEMQEEIRVLKEANQKLQHKKIQITYNYGLSIVQNMSLHEKVAKAGELVSQFLENWRLKDRDSVVGSSCFMLILMYSVVILTLMYFVLSTLDILSYLLLTICAFKALVLTFDFAKVRKVWIRFSSCAYFVKSKNPASLPLSWNRS